MNGLNCCFSSNKQSGTDSAVSTFSVVAYDSETGELGVAVASHYFAVGAVVPWAEADVGAVATQANVNVALGPRGLHLLKEGLNARDVLREFAWRTSLLTGKAANWRSWMQKGISQVSLGLMRPHGQEVERESLGRCKAIF